MHSFLVSVPHAAALWLLLLAGVALAAIALTRGDRLGVPPARGHTIRLVRARVRNGWPVASSLARSSSDRSVASVSARSSSDRSVASVMARSGTGRSVVLSSGHPGRSVTSLLARVRPTSGLARSGAGRSVVSSGRGGWSVVSLLVRVWAVLVAVGERVRPGASRGVEFVESEETRYARDVAGAADRAAAAAERRRAEWVAAQGEVDAAWRAFDEADRAAREGVKAGAYPLMSRRRKPGENADRQRWLHHAASEACRNRDISIAQLNEVFAHRGWNPRLHPVVQEVALRRAVRDHREAGYREAVEREREAWQRCERAAEALRTLRLQAAAACAPTAAGQPAAGEHFRAGQWTTAELPAAA